MAISVAISVALCLGLASAIASFPFVAGVVVSLQQTLIQLSLALQNRTSASAPLPNNQPVFNAYGPYQMMQAVPGQILTLTWPRTAEPDGTVADGSSQVNVYYNPNATINAGMLIQVTKCTWYMHFECAVKGASLISLTHALLSVHISRITLHYITLR